MPDTLYVSEKSSRRPMTWAALIAICAFLIIAWVFEAPWDILALWGLAILGLAIMLAKNPKYGIRLDDQTLTYWARSPEKSLPLADIDNVAFRPVTESSYVTVEMKSGETIRIFSDAFPSIDRAVAELAARGVHTTRE
jgi:hypothetical protein